MILFKSYKVDVFEEGERGAEEEDAWERRDMHKDFGGEVWKTETLA